MTVQEQAKAIKLEGGCRVLEAGRPRCGCVLLWEHNLCKESLLPPTLVVADVELVWLASRQKDLGAALMLTELYPFRFKGQCETGYSCSLPNAFRFQF